MSLHDAFTDFIPGIDARLDRGNPLRLAQRAGITPDPWQLQVLNSQYPTLLINCSRQAGKSTVVALLITATLLQPDQLILILSPGERQSKELMRRVLRFWRILGRPIRHISAGRTSLELVNGSRIEALPGNADTVVGFTPNLIVVDEAARVDDELYAAVSPMLAVSQGKLIALSTPKGRRGWWYELWHLKPSDDPDIGRVMVTAPEIPRIPAAFLRREQKTNPLYEQEYLCKFLDNQRGAFRTDDIAEMFQSDVVFEQELFEGIA